jgi:UDP-N-acetylmuramate dehydrogenase
MSSLLPPAGLRSQVPLAPRTSLRIGGPADYLLTVANSDEAAVAMRWAQELKLPCRWLGGGSNLLISDKGVDGLVLRFVGDRAELPRGDDGLVVVEAGRTFANLVPTLARAGWGGLEWAANVPGSVGGAVVNNAGAFGSSVAEDLAWAELIDAQGDVRRLHSAELGYGYRTSRLKSRELGLVGVVRAAFRVRRAPVEATRSRLKDLRSQRTCSQPRQLSAGSVFANPEGDYAGRLIEAAGLKEHRKGGAQISAQHANFIVNLGQAKGSEVYALMRLTQEAVLRRFGVWLQPEIELFGRWSATERAVLRAPAPEGRPR